MSFLDELMKRAAQPEGAEPEQTDHPSEHTSNDELSGEDLGLEAEALLNATSSLFLSDEHRDDVLHGIEAGDLDEWIAFDFNDDVEIASGPHNAADDNAGKNDENDATHVPFDIEPLLELARLRHPHLADDEDDADLSLHDLVLKQVNKANIDILPAENGRYLIRETGFGTVFADGVIELDEETESCTYRINTHMRVPADLAKNVERYCSFVNASLIERGFELVGDEIHFVGANPVFIRDGGNIGTSYRRVLFSVRNFASEFTLVLAGVDPWLVSRDSKSKLSARNPLAEILDALD